MSRPIEPVGITSIPAGASPSPSFMMAPLPNCFSICCRARSRALFFSLADGVVVSIICVSFRRGVSSRMCTHGPLRGRDPGAFPSILHIWAAGGKGRISRGAASVAPRVARSWVTFRRRGLEQALGAHGVDRALGRKLALHHADPIHAKARGRLE